jgi:hypothetical protein
MPRQGDFATVYMPGEGCGVTRSYFEPSLNIDGKPECGVSVSFTAPTDVPHIDVER